MRPQARIRHKARVLCCGVHGRRPPASGQKPDDFGRTVMTAGAGEIGAGCQHWQQMCKATGSVLTAPVRGVCDLVTALSGQGPDPGAPGCTRSLALPRVIRGWSRLLWSVEAGAVSHFLAPGSRHRGASVCGSVPGHGHGLPSCSGATTGRKRSVDVGSRNRARIESMG